MSVQYFFPQSSKENAFVIPGRFLGLLILFRAQNKDARKKAKHQREIIIHEIMHSLIYHRAETVSPAVNYFAQQEKSCLTFYFFSPAAENSATTSRS